MDFDGVFDTDTAADFTIMEEGTEFIERLEKGENLPIITSCSPGWVKFCEHYFRIFWTIFQPPNHRMKCSEL